MPANSVLQPANRFTADNARVAIQRLAQVKGAARAALVERMMRWETRHFDSGQYRSTGSGGMEDGAWGKTVAPYFPNGYNVVYFRDNNPAVRGTSAPLPFIVWPSVDLFVRFLSDYIDRHGGNYARWNSTNAGRQTKYRADIAKVSSQFVGAAGAVAQAGTTAVKKPAAPKPKKPAGSGLPAIHPVEIQTLILMGVASAAGGWLFKKLIGVKQ
jgi:hypothetical protein